MDPSRVSSTASARSAGSDPRGSGRAVDPTGGARRRGRGRPGGDEDVRRRRSLNVRDGPRPRDTTQRARAPRHAGSLRRARGDWRRDGPPDGGGRGRDGAGPKPREPRPDERRARPGRRGGWIPRARVSRRRRRRFCRASFFRLADSSPAAFLPFLRAGIVAPADVATRGRKTGVRECDPRMPRKRTPRTRPRGTIRARTQSRDLSGRRRGRLRVRRRRSPRPSRDSLDGGFRGCRRPTPGRIRQRRGDVRDGFAPPRGRGETHRARLRRLTRLHLRRRRRLVLWGHRGWILKALASASFLLLFREDPFEFGLERVALRVGRGRRRGRSRADPGGALGRGGGR